MVKEIYRGETLTKVVCLWIKEDGKEKVGLFVLRGLKLKTTTTLGVWRKEELHGVMEVGPALGTL